MRFASPIWLIALLPWAALGLWLLRRRGRDVPVPFVQLWRIPQPSQAKRRGRSLPPWMVRLLLAAMFLAIVGAAGPMLHGETESREPLTILVDRGITMSAGHPLVRYQSLAQQLQSLFEGRWGARQPVNLYFIPARPVIHTTLGEWIDQLNTVGPTAIDTAPLLSSAVEPLLASISGKLLLISDKPPAAPGDRMIVVAPQAPAPVVGISAIGARGGAHSQVMVRLHNQSPEKRVTLIIQSDERTHQQVVDLPPAPEETTAFVDLSALGRTVHAKVISDGEPWAADQAWLIRQRRPVRVRADSPIRGPLERMIDLYNRSQPPDAHAWEIRVVTAPRQADDQPAAILARDVSVAARPGTGPVAVTVTPGPLTAHVRWRELPISHIARPPAGNWQTVVAVGGQPALAISRDPPRRVWIGFDVSTWASRPDYVIFWKNIFDYLAGEDLAYQSVVVHQLDAGWKPVQPSEAPSGEPGLLAGLYRRADGRMLALNAPDVTMPPPIETDWRRRVARLRPASTGGRDLSGGLFLAALACAVGAMWMAAGKTGGRAS